MWFGDGRYLLFSDIPNNRILRWLEDTGEVSVFRSPSNYSNGNYRDREGRLLTCEHDSRCLTRTEHDGTITVLIDHFQGKPLNAPNDLAVHSDGTIWFTDPGYGIMSNYEGHKAPFELPANVYRLDPGTREARMGRRRLQRRPRLCARWQAHRQDSYPRDLRQSLFRWRQEEPSVHGGESVVVHPLRWHRGSANSLIFSKPAFCRSSTKSLCIKEAV